MALLTKTRPCQSKNPDQCRHHGKPLQKLEKELKNAKTSEQYLHIKTLIDQQKTQEYLQNLPQQKLVTHLDETKLNVETDSIKKDRYDNSQWAQYWVTDENTNKPIGFIKVHIHNDEQNNVEKVAVCDIEINPEFKGQNAALSTIRKIKTHFNVNHLECGETFSEQGHKMYQRLRGHELATGETTLKLNQWVAKNEPNLQGYGSYRFVKNWETKQPQYPL